MTTVETSTERAPRPAFDPQPVVLEGTHARLEPLRSEHVPGLFAAGRQDPELWRYMTVPPPQSEADVRAWVEQALAQQADGTDLPFAIVARADGRVAGSTRYMDIRRAHRGLEIGWTWLGPEWRRTPLNTECKYLLLRHAFEALGALRVQLKTDGRNERSQQAIARIGAQYEGTLRRHTVLHDGFVRDSVYYSVIDTEWPRVKAHLEAQLGRAA